MLVVSSVVEVDGCSVWLVAGDVVWLSVVEPAASCPPVGVLSARAEKGQAKVINRLARIFNKKNGNLLMVIGRSNLV